jgi:threo-3-hydroxy-L-aspartate ammonia-lyase
VTRGQRPLPIAIDDLHAAARRIAGLAHRTPLLRSRTLDGLVGGPVALKAENLQRAGAFKFRGACNAVAALRPKAVCSVSSGNHAQALALAAREHGARATILMPRDAPASKRAATEGYGAEVIEFDRFADDREALLRRLADERGLTIVHPYDEPLVMAGQGTVGLELAEEVDDLEAVLVPCGGGGLLSGVATAIRARHPGTRIVGVEPQASDDVARSLRAGERVAIEVRPTIADGQQLRTPGERTWEVIRALVDDVVTVSDAEILAAMRLLFERVKVVAEPSGASALAALLAGRLAPRDGTIGVVISGGNVDAARFAELTADHPA